jgi:multidrug efflux pump subunit AcrB
MPIARFRWWDEINAMPIKTDKQDHIGESVFVGDVGKAVDSGQLQYNIVRVDGQHSVYIPILKQGGGSNTISIVNGIREAVKHLLDIPKALKTAVVFDQSVFVKIAVKNVINEGSIGLCLTALMILLFLGNLRATTSVLLSIPISCLAAFIALNLGASTINTMVLGGIALALSRLIDNSVVVLENIFRHMELGEPAVEAAINGGKEVQLAVLAATCSTSIVFFPVIMLSGVSKYIFSALALAVVLALFASYAVAMTVVPLFCAKFIRLEPEHSGVPYSTLGGAEEAVQEVEREQRIDHANIFRRIVDGFQPTIRAAAAHLRKSYCGLSGPARIGRMQFCWFRGAELRVVSIPWRSVLPAHRSWAICDQCQSSTRNSS